MDAKHVLVLTTCPDAEAAGRLATVLVEEGLAACVNIQAGIRSVYKWQGVTESATEHLMFIKTAACRYSEVESAILAHHPYELPEVIAVPIVGGSKAYLGWMDSLVCVHS
jgi:periplasmic divalent cation tolerance protein